MELWRWQAYDVVMLEPGKTTYPFFENYQGQARSVRDISESEFIHWLINSFQSQAFFLSEVVNFNVQWKLEEKNLIAPNQPGDFDLLLFNENKPQETIEIEFKVFRSSILQDQTSKVNGLIKSINKGIDQANEVHRLQFHKNYLCMAMLDDGRQGNTPSLFHRYSNHEYIDYLFNDCPFEGLRDEVGIIFFVLAQPTEKDTKWMASMHMRTKRPAIEREQNYNTTRFICSLFDSN